jgi:site-specific recombinase XerD
LHASPRTIASYRDTIRLLLCFAQDRTGTAPSGLDWDQLDEPLIAAFLEHVELERHNSARTRNLRLTALRSLFRYAALRHPEHAAVIQRVLSIPAKRSERRPVTFLTAKESQALIDAPPQDRWEGRRDRAMLMLTIQAGLRVLGVLRLTDVPADGRGRRYLIERGLTAMAELEAVVADYLAQAERWDAVPVEPCWLERPDTRSAR